MDWNTIARFGRIVSTPATPTEEERAELKRLDVREDELTNLDDDEWTEALVEEADAIETRNDEIKAALEARAEFLEADRAISGCIATIREDGELRLIKGLVRPEDMPQRKGAADGTEADGADGEGEDDYGTLQAPGLSGPAASPVDPRAEARKEAGVGIGLADDLRAIRTTLVKAHLAQDFEAAFDLLLFQMGRAVFTGGYQADALDIAIRETPDRPPLRMNDDTFAQHSPGEIMLADRSGLAFDWLERQDDEDAFTALRALPEEDIRVTVTDDGTGVGDAAVLLSFGETGWDEATARNEDAAGMGLASLARRGCRVSSRRAVSKGVPDPGWRIALTPAHFLGEENAIPLPDNNAPYPNGTAVSFKGDETLEAIEGALARAALHYPLAVTFSGETVDRRAFLDGTVHAEPWRGIIFGAFKNGCRGYNDPDLNFHGLTLPVRLPHIVTLDSGTWTVRADIVTCPELELVLPARKEAVEMP